MLERAVHPMLRTGPKPRVLAHRGFVPTGALYVENTKAAFQAALHHGADIIETDVHVTRDGEVVLCHDASLERVANDARLIAALRFDEFAHVLSERGGALTLVTALESFPHTRFNIDVKVAEAAEATGEIAARYGDRVLLTGFHDEYRKRAIRAARAIGSNLPATRRAGERTDLRSSPDESATTPPFERSARVSPAASPGRAGLIRVLGAIVTRSAASIDRAFEGVDALQMPEFLGPVRVVTPRLLDEAHLRGVEVHVWTVNRPADMARLAAMGVDGLVTDRSDLALEVLRERRGEVGREPTT